MFHGAIDKHLFIDLPFAFSPKCELWDEYKEHLRAEINLSLFMKSLFFCWAIWMSKNTTVCSRRYHHQFKDAKEFSSLGSFGCYAEQRGNTFPKFKNG